MNSVSNFGIYAIVNLENGKAYIGSTSNLKERQKMHFRELRGCRHRNKFLQEDWNTFGESNFIFTVLQFLPTKEKKELYSKESYWIKHFKTHDREHGYNILIEVTENLGFTHAEETKAYLSQLHKNIPITPQAREAAIKANTGRPMAQWHREKLSALYTGRVIESETRAKLSTANKGKPRKAEAVAKGRATVEAKIAAGWKATEGKAPRLTEETKNKVRKLLSEGYTLGYISTQLKVSTWSVRNIRGDFNIDKTT